MQEGIGEDDEVGALRPPRASRIASAPGLSPSLQVRAADAVVAGKAEQEKTCFVERCFGGLLAAVAALSKAVECSTSEVLPDGADDGCNEVGEKEGADCEGFARAFTNADNFTAPVRP